MAREIVSRTNPSKDRQGRGQSVRALCLLVLSAMLTLCFGAGTANAARGLVTGFSEPLFESNLPGVRALWMDQTVNSGARLVRLGVFWRSVAPSPPLDPANPGSAAYQFSVVDDAVRDARARGLTVLLMVTGAPDWAEGPGRPADATPGTWMPDPSSLGSFMRAVAARYSGAFDPDGLGSAPPLPPAQAVQVWNEPNLPEHLTPQHEGASHVSPEHYRAMLNASYAAIKSVDPAMLVVAGATSPYGGPSILGPRLRPVEFDRRLLCVREVRAKRSKRARRKKDARRNRPATRFVREPGCGPAANFDVLAHHPINTSGAPELHALDPDDASSADLGRIVRVVRGAENAGTITPRRHPVWATELWWDSNPPNGAGSPLRRQARWLEQSLYLVWRAGASAAVNLVIVDPTAVNSNARDGSGSGVYFTNEQAKPSSIAFRFPFVTERRNKKLLLAWGKAPASGRLAIQGRARHRWTTIRSRRVTQGSVFTIKLRLPQRALLRATVAGNRSLVWRQAGARPAKQKGPRHHKH